MEAHKTERRERSRREETKEPSQGGQKERIDLFSLESVSTAHSVRFVLIRLRLTGCAFTRCRPPPVCNQMADSWNDVFPAVTLCFDHSDLLPPHTSAVRPPPASIQMSIFQVFAYFSPRNFFYLTELTEIFSVFSFPPPLTFRIRFSPPVLLRKFTS